MIILRPTTTVFKGGNTSDISTVVCNTALITALVITVLSSLFDGPTVLPLPRFLNPMGGARPLNIMAVYGGESLKPRRKAMAKQSRAYLYCRPRRYCHEVGNIEKKYEEPPVS